MSFYLLAFFPKKPTRSLLWGTLRCCTQAHTHHLTGIIFLPRPSQIPLNCETHVFLQMTLPPLPSLLPLSIFSEVWEHTCHQHWFSHTHSLTHSQTHTHARTRTCHSHKSNFFCFEHPPSQVSGGLVEENSFMAWRLGVEQGHKVSECECGCAHTHTHTHGGFHLCVKSHFKTSAVLAGKRAERTEASES